MTDIVDLKSWVLANAQQSRRPDVGDEIIAALGELDAVRAENERLKGELKIEKRGVEVVARLMDERDDLQAKVKNWEQLEEERKQAVLQMTGDIPSIERLVVKFTEVKQENERLRAALQLALPLLKDDIWEEETGLCSYCGGADVEDSGEHKDDCKQLLAFLAAREALESKNG